MATIAKAPQYSPYTARKARLKVATPSTASAAAAAGVAQPVKDAEPTIPQPTAAPVRAQTRSATVAASPAPAAPPISTLQRPLSVPTPAGLTAPEAAAAGKATPPLPTFDTASSRNQANYNYGITLADVNRALYNAALAYGGTPSVIQFGETFDPNAQFDPAHPYAGISDTSTNQAITPNDPLSAVAGANRTYASTSRADKDKTNDNNAFFSGHELVSQQGITNDRDRSLEQARRDYENAVATLTSQIQQAQGTRNTAFNNALAAEIANAASKAPEAAQDNPATPPTQPPADTPDPGTPEPTAPQPTAPAPSGTTTPTTGPTAGIEVNNPQDSAMFVMQHPKPVGADWDGNNVFLQNSGTRMGLWYRVVKRGSDSYRYYQNGDVVKI